MWIYSLKKLEIGHPVVKTLIKFNNNLEENDEEEKGPTDIEFTEQKTYPYSDENAIDFRWSGVKEEDEQNIALTNFIECLQSKLKRKFFKKVTK